MRKSILLLCVLSCILCACGNDVSREEFEALKARVDRIDGGQNDADITVEKEDASEWKTTEVTDGVPDSNEFDEFTEKDRVIS